MFFLMKRNQVSFLLIVVFVLGSFTVEAQAPPPMYARVSMMKVPQGRQVEFEQFMAETMKPVHSLRREKGKIILWILFRVHFTGANDEYNYAAVNYFSSWENTNENIPFRDLIKEAHPDTDPQEILDKLLELRTITRSLLLYRTDAVEPNPPVPSKYVRLDYMKVKPGQTQAYLKVEREDWMPFHNTLVKDGKSTGWGLWQLVFPGGTSSSYDYVTSNRYANYADVLGVNYEEVFRKSSPSKDINDIFNRTTQSRDLVRSELWEVVNILN